MAVAHYRLGVLAHKQGEEIHFSFIPEILVVFKNYLLPPSSFISCILAMKFQFGL